MPRVQIDQIRGSGQVVTNYNWMIKILRKPAIPFHVPGDLMLDFRCVTATEPVYSDATPMEPTIRGHTIAVPGMVKCSRDFKITVLETANLDMRKLFVPWLQATYDPITGIAGPDLAVTADIMLVRMNRHDIPLWEFVIFYAFPTRFSDGANAFANGATPGSITCEIDFAYTYFKQGLSTLSVASPVPVVL